MMDLITTADLQRLIEGGEAPLTSIYLPMQRKGPETRQNPLVLKSALKQVGDELENREMRRPDIEAYLKPAATLLDDSSFWQHQEDGLALFLDREGMHSYRLPESFEELVMVGESFHLKPLLPVLSAEQEFYVLALSHNQVRLLRGTRWQVSELELEDVPTSLAEALWYRDPEPRLHSHATSRGATALTFHGHGLGEESSDEELKQFFRQVDGGVRGLITDPRAPVVLAGVGYLHPIYRSISDLEVMEKGIEGNPDEIPAGTLHEKAWDIVSSRQQDHLAEAQEKVAGADDDYAARTVDAVVTAAAQGRIETLFVPARSQAWGRFDPETFEVVTGDGEGAVDLYDVAAVRTWSTGGDVFVVEQDDIPGEGEIAAVLRY
ncbi:MAG TPA: hypothetical protein VK088_10195 [Acidimicrobiia bacterium]|nr:hypothetical protein [Acidimicrobiia bacterium]